MQNETISVEDMKDVFRIYGVKQCYEKCLHHFLF